MWHFKIYRLKLINIIHFYELHEDHQTPTKNHEAKNFFRCQSKTVKFSTPDHVYVWAIKYLVISCDFEPETRHDTYIPSKSHIEVICYKRTYTILFLAIEMRYFGKFLMVWRICSKQKWFSQNLSNFFCAIFRMMVLYLKVFEDVKSFS